MNQTLSEGEVRVLYSPTGAVPPEELSRRLLLLEPDERARAMRFVFDKDRLNFATGRLIVRSVLASYAGRDAYRLPFVFNRYGRPELEPTAGLPPFRFNISHATGMVVVAFTLDRDVGVDVERFDRRVSFNEIARSFFAPREIEVIQSLAPEERPETFFAFWTLKEAYIKARGMGLSIPLAEFAFNLDPLQVTFSPSIADEPGSWLFWRGVPEPGYCVALAARKRAGERLDIHFGMATPSLLQLPR